MKQLSLKKAKALAWKACSDYIRERDNWTCFTCGRTGKGSAIHAGHFYPKKIGGFLLRFNEFNIHAQCYSCNRHFDGMGIIYSINYRAKYGPDADVKLLSFVEKSKAYKPTIDDYKEVITKYETKLRHLIC